MTLRNPARALLAVFLLLTARVWLNRRHDLALEPPGERWKLGSWFDGLGNEGLALAAAFLTMTYCFFLFGRRLGGDGTVLFVYVRSLVMDGDLNFTNEFADFVPEKFQFIADRALGRAPDPLHEPGPAIFWAPWFLLAHVLVLASRALGSTIPADGYSYPYINVVCFGSLVWAFVAVVLSYFACRRFFPSGLAAAVAILLWLSSTLYWYTLYEPSMPHAVGAAAVSLFLYGWLRLRNTQDAVAWVVTGVGAGLMLSVQRYNVFYLIVLLVSFAGYLPEVVARVRAKADDRRKGLALPAGAAIAFGLGILPLIVYNLVYSRNSGLPANLAEYAFRFWRNPRIPELLFSSNHGLFSWTPVAYLSVLGLFFLLRKDWRLALTLLLTLAGGVYLLSVTWDWYGGHAFGARRLTEGFLLFALGLCALAEWALARPKLLAVLVVAPLVLWNTLLADQFRRGPVPPSIGTFSFGDVGAGVAVSLHQTLGHLPSFPANWLFASKYGVGPGRFDAIYGHRPYHNLTIDVGSPQDDYFKGRGWSGRETTPDGRTFRWSHGQESSWLVPLYEPYDYRIRLYGQSSRHPDGRDQRLTLVVNGQRVATRSWLPGQDVFQVAVPARFWQEGLNEILFRYGWVVEAGEAYGSADRRPIAVRIERLELTIAD